MSKEQKLNRIEREIVRVLLKSDHPLTINEISNITGISWVTVKKYIPKLKNKGVIDGTKET